VGLATVLAIAPALAPSPTDTSADPAAASDRAPATTLYPVILDEGRVWLVEDPKPQSDGSLALSRAGVAQRLAPGRWRPGPTHLGRRFLLGSDALGRDLASRIVHGLRNSLGVAVAAALLALGAGVLVGATAALGGPRIDVPMMRAVDVAMATPRLFVVLAAVAALRPDPGVLVLLLAALTWMPTARWIRGELRALETLDFAWAARATGCSPARILVRHHLPHLAPMLLVQAALGTADLLLLEASLSFLGAGLPPPMASLGGLLAEAAARPLAPWWSLLFPGAALTLPVLALTAAAGAHEDRALHGVERTTPHRPLPADG
jgi:peptide/nickel transport system permease protein